MKPFNLPRGKLGFGVPSFCVGRLLTYVWTLTCIAGGVPARADTPPPKGVLQVDLKRCVELRGPRDESRNPSCCFDGRWDDHRLTLADSISAARIQLGKTAREFRIVSSLPHASVALTILSSEDSVLWKRAAKTDRDGRASVKLGTLGAPAWFRDGYYYLIIASGTECFKEYVYVYR